MMPAAIVATARRISGQFWMIRPSLILPPIRPRSSFGPAAGSKRYSLFEGRSRMRGINRKASSEVTAKTWSVKPPVLAYCSLIFWGFVPAQCRIAR